MEPFELIFNNDSIKGIHSGGFSVNSIMLQKGISPIKTWNVDNQDKDKDENKDTQTGGMQVADLFKSLVVPNWAFSSGRIISNNIKEQAGGNDTDSDDDSVISDELHNKLLDLLKEDDDKKTFINKKKYTKKNGGKRQSGKTKPKTKKMNKL
jgi:hypothetical protein